MTTTPKLLPCPFCGERVHLVAGNIAYVVCTGCSTEGPVTNWPDDYEGRRDAAIDAWNRRPSPWIACAERMPEPEHGGPYVLVTGPKGRLIASRCFSWWEDQQGTPVGADQVTHWQPLPPPPAPSEGSP